MSLLDYLAKECGVQYLSDLHYTDKWRLQLEKMDFKRWRDVNEWNEAASYLSGQICCFDTVAEAKTFLLNSTNNDK